MLVRDVAGGRTYTLVDGGVYATNPTLLAYAGADNGDVELLLSLGTGRHT